MADRKEEKEEKDDLTPRTEEKDEKDELTSRTEEKEEKDEQTPPQSQSDLTQIESQSILTQIVQEPSKQIMITREDAIPEEDWQSGVDAMIEKQNNKREVELQNQRKNTYANAVSSHQSEIKRKEAEQQIKQQRQNNSYTLYKIEPRTITVDQVIADIEKSLKVKASDAILGVHKNTRYDVRREKRFMFMIVFKSDKYIQQIIDEGMQIGETPIAPKRRYEEGHGRPRPSRGYIPNLPLYATVSEVTEILSYYGQVDRVNPRKRKDGVWIGGWHFSIYLEEEMPDEVHYEDTYYEVIYDGKVRKCRRCHGVFQKGHVCQDTLTDTETTVGSTHESAKETVVETESADEGNTTPPTIDGRVVTNTEAQLNWSVHFVIDEGQTFAEAHEAVAETCPQEFEKTFRAKLVRTGQPTIGVALKDEETAIIVRDYYIKEPPIINGKTLTFEGLVGTAATAETTDTDNMEVEEEKRRNEKRKLAPGSPFKKKKKDTRKIIEKPS